MENKELQELVEHACKTSYKIKALQEELQITKFKILEEMEEQNASELNTKYGKVVYMAFDKDILNKDKTEKVIEKINANTMEAATMEDFTRTVGIRFPLLKINLLQKEEIRDALNKEGSDARW